MKEYLKKHYKKLIFCILYGIIIMVIYNLVNSWNVLINYCNGAFIAGFSLVCFGGLSVINYWGGLDVFSYLVRKRPKSGPSEDLYTYSTRKREERKKHDKPFVLYFILGIFYILVSLIINIII